MSTLLEVYRKAVKRLENPEKDEINIRILLSTLANVNSMSDFYIKGDMEFKKEKQFNELFEKYLSGVPVDYLLHKTTFFGYDFYIDSRVLIPRQETEEVIEYAYKILKEKYGDKPLIIADICTGSGCAGIALAMKLNAKKLYLTDYSEQALLVAKKNVEKYKNVLPKTIIRKGDSMFPLIIDRYCRPDVVISNPPYIIDREMVDENVKKYEPILALYTTSYIGVYRTILSDVMNLYQNNVDIFFEMSDEVDKYIGGFARSSCPEWMPTSFYDMNGHLRCLYLKKY